MQDLSQPDDVPLQEEDGATLEYPDISSDIDEAINLMQPYVYRWNRCLEFTRGNQSYITDQPTYQYGTAGGRRKKVPVQINKLLPLYRNIQSRLETAYPSMAVLPASDSPDDLLKSRSGEQTLRYLWSALKVKAELSKMTKWLILTGNVGMHEFYDASKDSVELQILRPHDMVFEPYVTDPEESEWVCIRCYASKHELLKLYPESKEAIEEYAPSPITRTSGPQQQPKNRVEYRQIYWNDGRRAIALGGHYLWKGSTPEGIQPVQLVRYTEVSGFLWGIGLIEPNLDLQILYNETRGQIIRNIKKMANPAILCPEGSLRDPGKAFTGDEGEKVWINQGFQNPTAFSNNPLPQYALEEPTRLDLEIQDSSGIHSVSLGKRQSGVSSGKAINALAQNDMSQLQMTQEAIERGVTLVAQCLLVLVQAHYTQNKMVRMLDVATGTVVFQELRVTDIVGTPEIFLEAGTLFRTEAQDREAKIYDMLEAGLITPDQAKELISFRLMPLDVSEKMNQLRHAKDLLEAVVKLGAPMEVYPGEDNAVIKQVFKSFMDSVPYYQLTPERQNQVSAAYRVLLGNPSPQLGNKVPMPAGAPPPMDPLNEAVQGAGEKMLQSNEALLQKNDAVEAMGDAGSGLVAGQ
ncbi:hypothetical protein UFOVP777_8 [uncultured Caudovirales phage]|uniref:Head-to-tail connector protein, podovirus-type n=1 Tax=uncultured Caudovirales phage TaxID=2100421 RepID=A0A6J5NXW2_9CAUD|nr:hypothetical protein UFOVP777_8 [uncultured Caudovirales phage]